MASFPCAIPVSPKSPTWFLIGSLLVCIQACGLEGKPAPRGVTKTPPPSSATPAPAETATAPKARWRRTQTAAPAPASETANPDEEQKPKRDLNAELRASFGDPTPCVSSWQAAPQSTTVSVQAWVNVSGAVSRSSVSCPGAPAVVQQCLEQRLRQVRFRGPVDDAPTLASTRFDVLRDAPPAPKPAAKPAPTPPPTAVSGTPIQALPSQAPRGEQGTPIREAPSVAAQGKETTPISEPTSVPIQGPSGVPIGR